MAFWAIAAPLIAAGIGAAGARRTARNERIAQEKQNELYATTSIQKRVEDARAAGLHPLYALGAQPYTPAALPATGGAGFPDMTAAAAEAGAALDTYLAKDKTPGGQVYPETKNLVKIPGVLDLGPDYNEHEAAGGQRYHPGADLWVTPAEARERVELDALNASIEESRQRAAESRYRINKERAAVLGVPPEAIEMMPDQVTMSGDRPSHYTAGIHKFWSTYNFGPGLQIDLPSQAATQPLEAIAESDKLLAAVIYWNKRVYGDQWEQRAKEVYPDIFGRPGTRPSAPPSDVPVF